jgi:hypothetical protein
MASAERWRQGVTKCKSLRLTSMDPELLPLQLRHRWTSTAFKSDISLVRCSDGSIGHRRWAGRLHQEVGKFDIVHLHSVFLWPTWAAARAARNAGIRYLLSPRGMLVKELIARRRRLAKSAWIHLIERWNVEQAAARSRAIHGRSRAKTRRRAFQLGPSRCPDGGVVQQPQIEFVS